MLSAGDRAEKLLAKNQQLKNKLYYFELKLQKLKWQIAQNNIQAVKLLAQEHRLRKYKVE